MFLKKIFRELFKGKGAGKGSVPRVEGWYSKDRGS